MRGKWMAGVLAGAVVMLVSSVAAGDTMHPRLAARLSGMGEHGIVNFESTASAGKLCWTFELGTKGITGATIRDAHGMIVVHLGKAYRAKACEHVTSKALLPIETKPSAYRVWVDTKGHPGDLRGKLFAGMAHM
jgi:hypothetical protein